MALTIVAMTSSMFWFPAPAAADPRATAFLAIERQYITGPWTIGKVAMTTLVPFWFIALAWAFWRRSWVGGFIVISVGTLLKIIWASISAARVLGPLFCRSLWASSYVRASCCTHIDAFVTGLEDRLSPSTPRRAEAAPDRRITP